MEYANEAYWNARHDALEARLSALEFIANSKMGTPVAGQYYDNNPGGGTLSAVSMPLGTISLGPYMSPPVPVAIDRIGVVVSVNGSGALSIMIYEAGADGWPEALLLETARFTTSTAGLAETPVDFTFAPSKLYWMGVFIDNFAPQLKCFNTSTAKSLGPPTNTPGSSSTVTQLKRSLDFHLGTHPNPWNYVEADRASTAAPPIIRMRAA